MPFTIDNTNKRPIVIPDASETEPGVIKLSDIPASAGTLADIYDNGSSVDDQTMTIAAGKGGGVILKAATAALGSMLKAFTSASDLLFDIIDGAVPTVIAAGTFIQNDPGFGSPMLGAQPGGDGFMSYTADGVGALWGGSGVSPFQDPNDPTIGITHITAADDDICQATSNATVRGLVTSGGQMFISVGPSFDFPVLTIAANAVTINKANMSPVFFIGDGLLKTITVPFPTDALMWLIPTGAGLTWDNTGNIVTPAGAGSIGKPILAIFRNNTGKFYLS